MGDKVWTEHAAVRSTCHLDFMYIWSQSSYMQHRSYLESKRISSTFLNYFPSWISASSSSWIHGQCIGPQAYIPRKKKQYRNYVRNVYRYGTCNKISGTCRVFMHTVHDQLVPWLYGLSQDLVKCHITIKHIINRLYSGWQNSNCLMHVTVQQKAASYKYLYAVFYVLMVIKNSLPVVKYS